MNKEKLIGVSVTRRFDPDFLLKGKFGILLQASKVSILFSGCNSRLVE